MSDMKSKERRKKGQTELSSNINRLRKPFPKWQSTYRTDFYEIEPFGVAKETLNLNLEKVITLTNNQELKVTRKEVCILCKATEFGQNTTDNVVIDRTEHFFLFLRLRESPC